MSRTSIAAWALILAMCGCQSTQAPPEEEDAPDAAPIEADTPQGLLESAAEASGLRQARLYLRAAEGLIEAADFTAAADALARVDTSRLRERESARYLLARARLAIHTGELQHARAALLGIDENDLPDPMSAALTMARLINAEGRSRAAAEYLMGYRPPDPDQQARRRLNEAIWRQLGDVPPLEVLVAERQASGASRGWWQLKELMFQSFTLSEQRRRLERWREARPNHPAALDPPAALLALTDQALVPVTRVALMVPLSGNLSRAGRAVRDGFIASYLSHRDDVGFQVMVYDTAAEPVPTLYERALVDGAEVIIGPLSKESVTQMNTLNPEVPVLALNYLGDDEPPAANLLQLGLAIEDEAATLRQWLEDEGVERLLVLHNAEDWAQRARRTLTSGWRGTVTVQALEDIRTVTESVGVAMHVAASEDRHGELQDVLGASLEFLPRARDDVDAILALVTHLEASALVPALRFHFADQVPVYATSQTVRGASEERLRELAGFHVSELPWFALSTPSFRALDAAFGLEDSPFAALYALGVDAFRLAERLPMIQGGAFTEVLGSTGELEFAADGRINRRLARAVVRGGEVRGDVAVGR